MSAYDSDSAVEHSQSIKEALCEFGISSISEVSPMDALDIIASLTDGWAAELASHVYLQRLKETQVYFEKLKESIDN